MKRRISHADATRSMCGRGGDPAAAAELGEVERRSRLGASGFRASCAHGNGLLEPPDLGAHGRIEEVDVPEALVILGQTRLLLDHALGRRLLVEALQHLAVPERELLVVAVARLVERPEHVGLAQVLDLLNADQGRVAALALHLLREPLEVLVASGVSGRRYADRLRAPRPASAVAARPAREGSTGAGGFRPAAREAFLACFAMKQ